MKKKVLFIHHGKGIGGASICLNNLILELGDDIDATVLCIKNSDAVNYFQENGINTKFLDTFFYRKIYTFFSHLEGRDNSILRLFPLIRGLMSYIFNSKIFAKKIFGKYNNYDLVYLNSTFLSDWAIAAKKEGFTIIMHVREPLGKGTFGLRREMIRKAIKNNVAHIISISKDNANRINLSNKTTIIYDPIREIGQIAPINYQDELNYFLYLGGIQKIKGFYVLVRSLKYLKPNIRIFFAGDLNSWQQGKGIKGVVKRMILYPFIKKLKKSNKAIELGVVHNIFDYLQASKALLFPSTIPHFSNPVMEAYKIGKPVIVSDVDGMEEIVDRNTGLFFKKGKPRDLAKKINLFTSITNNDMVKYYRNCKLKYDSVYSNNKKILMVINQVFGN